MMISDKSVYRKLLNQLSFESGKPFYFFKNELATSEIGFMVTDASLLVADKILNYLKQPTTGFAFKLEPSRYLPLVAQLDGDMPPFAKLAPVLVYVFDNYIIKNNMHVHDFYTESCMLVSTKFSAHAHTPWVNELNQEHFNHLDPSLHSETEPRVLRPTL